MSTEVSQLSNNQSVIAEEIAELVVTAIGANGRQYLCWKTPTGEYRQYRYCLPERLDKWLFPKNGATRHFETLQVVLSSDDRFWAADKDGQIQSEEILPASSKDGNKRRSELFSQRPWRTSRDTFLGTERRRAATVSPAERDFRQSQKAGFEGSHSRSSSLGAVPLAAALRRPKRFSGQQFVNYPEYDVLKEDTAVSSRSSLLSQESLRQPPRCSACWRKSCTTSLVSWGSDATEVEKPLYIDSSAQTDLASPSRYRKTDITRASPTATIPSSADFPLTNVEMHPTTSSPATNRSSYEEGESPSSQLYFEPQRLGSVGHLTNPISMGRMQEYFRAGNYALGDALR